MPEPTLTTIQPGSFSAEKHWYPKALNATLHPMVAFFLSLDPQRIIARYCHLNPRVRRDQLEQILSYRCKYFIWSGADLINATDADGNRQMVIIENNSCPSGQKSMPLRDDFAEQGSYRQLIERTFKPMLAGKPGRVRVEGDLAVIYDKNPMETSGYAAVIADVFGEPVHLVTYFQNQANDHIEWRDRQLYLRTEQGEWRPIRAAFRYVTQRPWTRIPLRSKTRILNPIIACLAGGRNKMVAAKAYDFLNAELEGTGLSISTPQTIWDVSKAEIPLWVERLGGQAVIKIPYSNAGQGVYTIVNEQELDRFMEMEHPYERFIVQSLIGNYEWSSNTQQGKFYHVGTIPDAQGRTFVTDLRMMVSSTPAGIRPLGIYGRKAELPLVEQLEHGADSWKILGTNLSMRVGENEFTTDTNRLMLTDRRDFNKLGIALDDLIEAYIQTVLSTIAIDKMCKRLINTKGKFRMKLFRSLNDDDSLIEEILKGSPPEQ